ncbi:hypothetical protein E3N88_17942 [Mikania micrantha]|uniref:Uncharacterized protein n=1 Tax=Mikania micrantha TaxID=192012 RepID=A0A5N6NTF5_9ASTR|nr:hypothetical protein E3N88_17942 [Mikania micrantha]
MVESFSSTYKNAKDENVIKILDQGFEKDKKAYQTIQNSIGILNGLVISDIRNNMSTLSDILDYSEDEDKDLDFQPIHMLEPCLVQLLK